MRAVCSSQVLDHRTVDAVGWAELARAQAEAGARLLTLWAADERPARDGFAVHACWIGEDALVLASLPLAPGVTHYPGLHEWFPVADRLQRAARDLVGVAAQGMDPRPWLRHAWGPDAHPLRFGQDEPVVTRAEPYAFVPVDGEGVHEIGVGPVHAGVIEPGQFRFSVVGEKVLRLEQRLGYTHKGVARRFQSLAPAGGLRLAARLSGDSAVANGWAYCMALEALAGVQAPPRALALRALLLERERIANHLGDLGAIGNDAGFGFALAQFSRVKEDLLRLNARVFGARYPMDALRPGGVTVDLDAEALAALRAQGVELHEEVARLHDIFDQHEGVQDRFASTGRVAPELARRLGLIGLAGRASAQALDLRCRPGWQPYEALQVNLSQRDGGDVAARVGVRFAEIFESLRLCRELLEGMPGGAVAAAWPQRIDAGLGLGLVEGWRGPALIALQLDEGGRIARCHAHDPSWQNWPALEWAVIRDIVPDFPLINKSFNLSYSGHDG